MPSVKVASKSPHSAEETYQRLKNMLENDPTLRQLDSNYSCQFDDSNLSGSAKGGKFSAKMNVASEGGGANAEIVVELPFLLSPFKGQVQSTLESKLQKALA